MSILLHPAMWIPAVQVCIGLVGGVLGWIVHSPTAALSVLLGSLVAAGPQCVFGWWAFRVRGARKAKIIAQNLFIGEGLKLSLTAILFALLWSTYDELMEGAVLAGFVAAILVGQLSLPFMMGRSSTH